LLGKPKKVLQKIAHVINPVLVSDSSDLFIAQPITFESMRIAQQQAADQVAVDLLAVGYGEDNLVMPDDFQALPPLTRSVLDVATFQNQRKLPLLKDILDRLYSGSEADILVYTNVDIGLQPDFYLTVQEFVEQGFDAFVINRRTIPNTYTAVTQLPQMWAEAGESHRGWDCFVFRRDFYPKFVLGDICIGAPRVGLALLANLTATTNRFREFKEEQLTFHLGDDRSLKNSPFRAYADHNTRELDIILARLKEIYGSFPLNTPPGAYLFKRRNFGWLYETWVKRVYLPVGWSRRLNHLFGKLPGTH
jgi:hypothetical protein